MNGRERRIQAEAAALWRELHGEPPPIHAEGGHMLDAILQSLPPAPYDRIRSPYLRPSAMSWPTRKRRRDQAR